MPMTVPATMDILTRGMDCLVKSLGVVDAEYFISTVKREQFDYTKWQAEAFNDVSLDDFIDNAVSAVNQK